MLRYRLPFLLCCLGMIVAAAARDMPLSEWTATVETADFDPDYEVVLDPPPWVVGPGRFVLDDEEIKVRQITVLRDSVICAADDFDVTVELSPPENPFHRLWIESNLDSLAHWPFDAGMVAIPLSVLYVIVMIVYIEQRPSQVVEAILIILATCIGTVVIMALFGPATSTGIPAEWIWWEDVDCQGSLALRVSLLQVHKKTIAVLAAGAACQVAAVVLMVWGVIRALRRRSIARASISDAA